MAKDFTMSFKMNVTGMEQVTSAIRNVESMSKRLNTQVNVMGERFRKSSKRIHRVKNDMFQLYQGTGNVTTQVNVMGQSFGNANEKMNGMKKGMDTTATSITKGITQTAKLNDQIKFLRTPKIAETLGLNVNKTGQIFDRATGNAMSMDGAMQRMQRLPIDKMQMLNQSLEDHNRRTKEATQGVSRFKMEWLGVMFFGMAMAGFFMGLLMPAAQAFGIFDMWSAMLLTVFAPAMEMIMPPLFAFMEWMMNLPEPVQKAIGVFAIIGFVFGTFLFILGQTALGITSLMKAFSLFNSVFTAISAGIKIVAAMSFGTLMFWIVAIIAAVALLYTAWKNNWGNIREHFAGVIRGIINIFSGIWDFIKGFISFIWHLFTDWSKLGNDLKLMMDGIWQIFVKGFGRIIGEVLMFGVDLFKGMITWIDEKTGGLITKFVNLGKSIGNAIADGFRSFGLGFIIDALSGAKNIGVGITTKIKDWIGLADGGIVRSPTNALIGEAGPEAVIPLNKMGMIGGGAKTVTYAPTYNISAVEFRDELDKRALLNDLNDSNYNDLKQLNIR